MKVAVFVVSFIAILGSTSALAQSASPHTREIMSGMKTVQWNWKKRAEKVEQFNRALATTQVAQSSGHPSEIHCERSARLAQTIRGTVLTNQDQF